MRQSPGPESRGTPTTRPRHLADVLRPVDAPGGPTGPGRCREPAPRTLTGRGPASSPVGLRYRRATRSTGDQAEPGRETGGRVRGRLPGAPEGRPPRVRGGRDDAVAGQRFPGRSRPGRRLLVRADSVWPIPGRDPGPTPARRRGRGPSRTGAEDIRTAGGLTGSAKSSSQVAELGVGET